LTTVFRMDSATNMTASSTWVPMWIAGLGVEISNRNFTEALQLPPAFYLPGGMRIRTNTVNIDVGDQWQNVALYVVELRERTTNELVQHFEDVGRGRHVEQYPGLRVSV
ncbi:MAG: hypothetical protein ACREM8_10525, partial [Vulcanimicrobiaceae bacterium]